MTERDLQAAILDLCHLYGWRVAHFRPALTSRGWRTPVSADGAGFPDLVLVRERVVAVEIKSQQGRLTMEQMDWLEAFRKAGVEAHTWRPLDFPAEVVRVLKPPLKS